jgi:hypothetical protein
MAGLAEFVLGKHLKATTSIISNSRSCTLLRRGIFLCGLGALVSFGLFISTARHKRCRHVGHRLNCAPHNSFSCLFSSSGSLANRLYGSSGRLFNCLNMRGFFLGGLFNANLFLRRLLGAHFLFHWSFCFAGHKSILPLLVFSPCYNNPQLQISTEKDPAQQFGVFSLPECY